MFRRVTNTDLLNRIIELENKMDQYCNYKDIYEDIGKKQDQIIDFLDTLKDKNNIDRNLYQKMNEIYVLFSNYIENDNHKIKDLGKINNFEEMLNVYTKLQMDQFVEYIEKLYALTKNDDISDSIINIDRKLSEINNKIMDFDEKLNEIYSKIDLLYYENETIKHQFLLEEDIRKYECEINSLSNIINKTIQEIEKIMVIHNKYL